MLTTAEASPHPESETRIFSAQVRDDRAQTERVMRLLAAQAAPKCKEKSRVYRFAAQPCNRATVGRY